MTTRERIYHMMLIWAYTNARQLGMSATDATEEAFEVGDFIKRDDATILMEAGYAVE